MSRFFSWLLSVLVAFILGTGYQADSDVAKNSELSQKIQDHIDVIVDESAAIVDDVVEEIRNDERVQDAEAFVDDVKEIVNNTKDDIKAHFGDEEDEAETEEEAEAETEKEAAEVEEEAETEEETEAE